MVVLVLLNSSGAPFLWDDPQYQIVCLFNIVQTAFDPPPLVLNIYVADYIADISAK